MKENPADMGGNYVNKYFRVLWKVKHEDYMPEFPKGKWKSFDKFGKTMYDYAYGILINPFNTRLFVLDFDNVELKLIEEIAGLFLDDYVSGIDIIRSSALQHYSSYHLMVGFKDYRNICSLYKIDFPGSCAGFTKFADSLGEVVLRISDKKQKKTKVTSSTAGTIPEYVSCIRSIKNRWYVYTADDIILPHRVEPNLLNNLELTTDKKQTPKLDLRRARRGHNNSKPKSKGKEATTVSCIEDIIALSRTNGPRRKVSSYGSNGGGHSPF